jgi:hypothetical protein
VQIPWWHATYTAASFPANIAVGRNSGAQWHGFCAIQKLSLQVSRTLFSFSISTILWTERKEAYASKAEAKRHRRNLPDAERQFAASGRSNDHHAVRPDADGGPCVFLNCPRLDHRADRKGVGHRRRHGHDPSAAAFRQDRHTPPGRTGQACGVIDALSAPNPHRSTVSTWLLPTHPSETDDP